MVSLEKAIEFFDLYARRASRRILEYIEQNAELTPELRKVVLDAVNDFKREALQQLYDVH